jgi:anti-sigma regulatory factor (Ser/Thr protein kinase)
MQMQALKVRADLDALETIGEYVSEAAEEAGLDQKAAYGLSLAVDEIATNIIMYGYGEDNPDGVLEVRADHSEAGLAIILEDTAAPYDPTQAAQPELNRAPEQREAGGLGIYLAIRSVDVFQYERVGDRNRNVFTVKIDPK